MLIFQDKKFIKSPFLYEADLEKVVIDNYEFLFGPNSIFLPKAKIKTADGAGTIPDGFAIDIENRKWYIVEAELVHHSVWNHIAPQVTKQLVASRQKSAKMILTELIVNLYKTDNTVKEKFEDNNIGEINVRKVIDDILETQAIVGLPIDGVTKDLTEWAFELKATVKIWVINKFVELNNPTNIVYEFPEEYKPTLDTEDVSPNESNIENPIQNYDVDIFELLEAKLLSQDENLILPYKPRNGQSKTFEAKILDDGSLEVLGQQFSSPSYAAIACIQNAGSDRKTVNGWTSWRTKDGKTLSEVREIYLNKPY
jgi:hypothetical protein